MSRRRILLEYPVPVIEHGMRNRFHKVSSEKNPARPVMFAHAESPVWDAHTQSLTFVDVSQQNVHRLEYTTGKIDTKHIGTKGPQTGDDVLPDKGTLYTIDQQSLDNPRIQLRPVSISNGLAWSPNNTVMYYIDSHTQRVDAFDYDSAKGDLSARRTIVDISNYGYEDAIPDGMTIDSKGHLWVALMFGGT
ncbi:hypothetical protein evm_015391, partial [Chilo suppressalis]